MSSRLRAVRIFTLTYEKMNVFGAPPEPSTPAADVPPRSRLRGVLIFEEKGALAVDAVRISLSSRLLSNDTVNFKHSSRSSRRSSVRRGRYINPNDIQIA